MVQSASPESRTYRNVRLAMIAVLVLLAVSVLIERFRTDPRCWQGSISAYYYTPARAIFVCSVLAVGVCMIVLKGSTKPEDVLLNIGGMFAPVVALVPTPGEGSCSSVSQTLSDPSPSIANNMWALFIAGSVALAVSFGIKLDANRDAPSDGLIAPNEGHDVQRSDRWSTAQDRALAASSLILVAGLVWFVWFRPSFKDNAHYVAALAFFAMIISIVWLNGRDAPRNNTTGPVLKRRVTKLYRGIAIAMGVCIAYGVLGRLLDWKYSLLHVEVALILLFLAFWITQTKELWTPGLRPTADTETAPLAK
ncbi:hypothetical protein AB0L70_34305 [Kribbella sp. NPDC051952]|uniref:hypothetical protein n=1 Tax=Kribbella sp. NPDC051952 TaxID=3154851 RepID=UPI003418C46F